MLSFTLFFCCVAELRLYTEKKTIRSLHWVFRLITASSFHLKSVTDNYTIFIIMKSDLQKKGLHIYI